MSNPFLQLQERLVALLRARPYFTGLPADATLTEQVGDIESKIANDLLPLGFGFAVTTAKGDGSSSLGVIRTTETLCVAFIHNPTLDPGHAVLDALWEGMQAIVGQPIFDGAPVCSESDVWRFAGHERRLDAPPELHVHHLYVTAAPTL